MGTQPFVNDGSPKYYCGDCNVHIAGISTGCNYPECGGIPDAVEPSESQEETQESLIREIMDTYAHRWHHATTENQHKNVVQEFWEKFTITRK